MPEPVKALEERLRAASRWRDTPPSLAGLRPRGGNRGHQRAHANRWPDRCPAVPAWAQVLRTWHPDRVCPDTALRARRWQAEGRSQSDHVQLDAGGRLDLPRDHRGRVPAGGRLLLPDARGVGPLRADPAPPLCEGRQGRVWSLRRAGSVLADGGAGAEGRADSRGDTRVLRGAVRRDPLVRPAARHRRALQDAGVRDRHRERVLRPALLQEDGTRGGAGHRQARARRHEDREEHRSGRRGHRRGRRHGPVRRCAHRGRPHAQHRPEYRERREMGSGAVRRGSDRAGLHGVCDAAEGQRSRHGRAGDPLQRGRARRDGRELQGLGGEAGPGGSRYSLAERAPFCV
mmetsp:Transcript_92991/g.277578  ORF Transcript_92991/g.277578 Transcript_92991/m.277578 type:complete len:345 (-) Transcript_92991:1229-2263(-)